MRGLVDFLLSRDSDSGNFRSFVILGFRFFCGLMMLPYGYGKILNYDRYAADFFGDPIGIGDIPSLWLTIFAQTVCPIMLLLGFQTPGGVDSGIQHAGRGQVPFLRPFQRQSPARSVFRPVCHPAPDGGRQVFIGLPFVRQGRKRTGKNEVKALLLFFAASRNSLVCAGQLFFRGDFRLPDCTDCHIVFSQFVLRKER